MKRDIWCLTEYAADEWQATTYELIYQARKLADVFGNKVIALVLGRDKFPEISLLKEYGADLVYTVEHPLLELYSTEAHLLALEGLVSKFNPVLLLLASTYFFNNIAARLSVRLDTGFVSNCVKVHFNSEGILEMTQSSEDGKNFRTYISNCDCTQLATILPEAIGTIRISRNQGFEVIPLSIELDDEQLETKIKETQHLDAGDIDIEDAEVVFTIGRGLGSTNNIPIVYQLAYVLHGSVGGTRRALDCGLIEQGQLIGQTGKTVSPRLMISCGVSGAVHHAVGIRGSKCIIAINSDEHAPILNMSDIAVISDCTQFLPVLGELINSGLTGEKLE
ncbi:electron transfer flavoprotein subunit alpha/FixB family protein [Chloroflexota bacterium]